jgi:hypothetical protein
MNMSIVIDWLFIKTIQKTIRRELTPEEMEIVREGEPLWVQKPNGVWMSYRVPHYRLPYDLTTTPVDPRAIEEKAESASIFDYAFNVGTIKKVSNG